MPWPFQSEDDQSTPQAYLGAQPTQSSGYDQGGMVLPPPAEQSPGALEKWATMLMLLGGAMQGQNMLPVMLQMDRNRMQNTRLTRQWQLQQQLSQAMADDSLPPEQKRAKLTSLLSQLNPAAAVQYQLGKEPTQEYEKVFGQNPQNPQEWGWRRGIVGTSQDRYQYIPFNPIEQKMFGAMLGGGQQEPTMLAGEPQPGMLPGSQSPSSAPAASVEYMPEPSLDAKGQMSYKFQPVRNDISTYESGNKRIQTMTNPYSGQMRQQELGPSADTEAMKRAAEYVQNRLNVAPDDQRFKPALGAYLAAERAEPGTREQLLKGIEQQYGVPGGVSTMGAAMQGADTRMTQQAGAKAQAEERAKAGALSEKGIQGMVDYTMATGTIPPMGFAGPIRDRFFRALQDRIGPEGWPAFASRVMTLPALKRSMGQLEAQRGTMEAWMRTADKNLQLIDGIVDAVEKSDIPALNKLLIPYKMQVQGKADVAGLQAAIRVGVNETARVLSSATGAGMVTDSQRQEQESLLNVNQTPAQIRSVIGVLRREMNNRQTSYNEQRQSIQDTIQSTVGGRATPTSGQQLAPTPAGSQRPSASGGFSSQEAQAAASVKSALQSGMITPQKAVKRLKDAGFSDAEAAALVGKFRGAGR